ncbi:transcription antitermination factor NusB [Glycomyces halotolerans]
MTRSNPRHVAFEAIRAVSAEDAYANLVLPRLISGTGLDGRDAALATELTYGTLRTLGTLERIVEAAAGRGLDTLQTDLIDALCLGAYQLLYTRIPTHAAVSTTVILVKAAVGPRVSGLANAVMRKVAARDLDGWLQVLATGDRIDDLALRYAHPRWIVEELDAILGSQELQRALEADNLAPPVHLCARPGRIDRDDLVAKTGGEPGRWSPYSVYLSGGEPGRFKAVATGRAGVQDEGSQLVATALANAPIDGRDTAWVDLCAGPGGKTALLGSLAAQRGASVDAVEIAPHRAELVVKATKGLPVTVHTGDGRDFGEPASADRVLVDAPCSGLGALRRRPEARWRKRPSDVDDLALLQRRLLESAVRLLRPGGVVAYVTCSPVTAETVDVARSVRGVDVVARQVVPDSGRDEFTQLWPHRHGTDAMFLALLRRRD